MSIQANSGVDITSIFYEIYKGKDIEEGTPNYFLKHWSLLHVAARVGNKSAMKQFLKSNSIDIESLEIHHTSDSTPRIILQNYHPEILSELEQENHI
jgi:hypothetical protein